MVFKQALHLKQRQELRMTPQLQQAIKLLQMSRLELAEAIDQELIENPTLEEMPTSDERSEKVEQEVVGANTSEAEAEHTKESTESAEAKEAVDDIDWESYVENYSSPLPASGGVSSGGSDEMPSYEQTLKQQTGLAEHLLEQLGTVPCNDEESAAAQWVIGNLDDDGYLRDASAEEIAAELDIGLEMAEDGISLVQELDPAGVGARDLAECLALQIRATLPDDAVALAVAETHLDAIERRDYAAVARALGTTKERIYAAHRTLQSLDPRPGRQFVPVDARYIIPDIYIVKRNGEWQASLNDDGLPMLRVSNHYKAALRSSSNKQAKEYVQERMRSAMWMIRSIQQRQRTILKVTEAIIAFQHDFFELGVAHLKPLVLRQVAEEIEMHESTVSRVTTNKYAHTPRGIFELKYFFNSSIATGDGDTIAAESVKHHIKNFLAEENPRRPLSDQKLVTLLLETHDIDIARRTVAKYREQLGIASSSKRKTLI